MDLIKELENHTPFDELEKVDTESFKQFLTAFGDFAYSRDCLVGHIAPTAWIVNPSHTKVLMAHHNIYNSFAWLGGHADEDKDCLRVVLKEINEESGLNTLKVLNDNKIFDVNAIRVMPHMKRGKQVSHHIHFNPTYLIEADENEELKIAEGENSALKWIACEDVLAAVTEEYIKPIYARLMKKVELL